jgi:hypothetical protein
MFKKKLAILAAAAMLTLSASSAFAAFGNLELVRVTFNQTGGTTEIATDLGNVSTVLAGGTFGAGANAFTAQAGGTSFSNLNSVYFAVNTTTKELWITGVNPSIFAGKSATITSLTTSIFNYYNTFGTTTVLADASNPSSYRVKADSTNQFGQFGTAITAAARPYTEANLAALATGGSVTQDIYYFASYAAAGAGVKVGSITTNANGSSTVTATPIPAAFYLMGSGLLGLVGLRRRNNA